MNEKGNVKVTLYVKSININTRSIANQQGGGKHPCDRGMGFMSYRNPSVNLDGISDRIGQFYTDEDWNALNIARMVREKTGVTIELVDVGKSLWSQLKLTIKGLRKTPLFIVDGEPFSDISNAEQLLSHLK